MLKRVLISSVAILATAFCANATGVGGRPDGGPQRTYVDSYLTNIITNQRYLEAAISQAVQPIRLYDLDGDGLDQNDIDAVANSGRAQAVAMRMQQWVRYDLNLDGKITKKEVELTNRLMNGGRGGNGDGNLESFARADLNGDGVITWDELVNAQGDGPDNYARHLGRMGNVEGIMSLDQNGDGKVTVEEATNAVKAAFASFDQNGNGVLEQDELRKAIQSRNPNRGVPF